MPTPIEIKCFECKNFLEIKKNPKGSKTVFSFICKAFPKQIPEEIRNWRKPHKKVRNDQIGDFIFKPI